MEEKDNLPLFSKISASLTGFSEMELWGTGMMETYYNYVMGKCGESSPTKLDLEYFFEKAKEIYLGDNNDENWIDTQIQTWIFPPTSYGGLAQLIITLWYTGNWGLGFNGSPISAQAYVQGLIWNAGETHPSGAKQPGFGSWNIPPINIKK